MAHPSTPLTPPRDPGSPASWSTRLMGPAGTTRQAIKRYMWLLPTYLFVTGMLVLALYLEHAPAGPVKLLLAYIGIGLLVFYVLLRSGWSARCAEPSLAFAQVLFSIGAVLMAYALIEASRALALQWLCLSLVFDMHRLSKRQTQLATLLAVLGLLSIVAAHLLTEPHKLNIAGELVNVGMASLTMPLLVAVAGLARRMRRQSAQQHQDLQSALAQLSALAIRDGLTRCFTRRHLQQLLDEEATRQKRTRRIFCVAMLDIDFFKKVNDAFGHAVGDAVLVDFARLAQASAGHGHALGRWGGEEFVLLMPDTSLPQAMATLESLRRAMHQHDWGRHAPGLAVTFSAGVCQHQLGDHTARVIEQADQALYSAKAAGRDRIAAAASTPMAVAVSP